MFEHFLCNLQFIATKNSHSWIINPRQNNPAKAIKMIKAHPENRRRKVNIESIWDNEERAERMGKWRWGQENGIRGN